MLMAEKCHRHTVQELDTEKRKHADYMNKSDDFTNLLEQERERWGFVLGSPHLCFSSQVVFDVLCLFIVLRFQNCRESILASGKIQEQNYIDY